MSEQLPLPDEVVQAVLDNHAPTATRPPVEQFAQEMLDNSMLTREQLLNVGIDSLYFLWSLYRSGVELYAKRPGQSGYSRAIFTVRGLIEHPQHNTQEQ